MRANPGWRCFGRNLKVWAGAAAFLAAGASPAYAGAGLDLSGAMPAPTSLLPLQMSGLFGFEPTSKKDDATPQAPAASQSDLGGDSTNGAQTDTATSAPIDAENAASAETNSAPAPQSNSATADQPPVDPYALLTQYVPAEGQWQLVPGTEFDAFRLSDDDALALGILGNEGSRAVLSNSGSAYDPSGHYLFFWGGGGTSYGGNEVYRLDLELLQMTQLTLSSLLDSIEHDANGIACPIPLDGPGAASAYDGIIWSRVTQTFFVFPTSRFCMDGTLGLDAVWEFDPATGQWSQIAGMSDLTGPIFAEYDPVTETIIVIDGGPGATIREFNPVTGSATAPVSLGLTLTSGSAIMRRDTGELMVLSQEGVQAVSLADFGQVTHLSDLPVTINVDANAGAVYDANRGLVVIWDGGKDVGSFDPETLEWALYANSSGPTKATGGVFSKWIYIEELDVFAGYHNPAEGLWLYSLAAQPTATGGPANGAPVADAGADQTVSFDTFVQLDASSSHDPDGDQLSYAWEFVAKPAGSAATISNPNIVGPTFLADVPGSFTIRVTVNAGGLSDQDTVAITAVNNAPVADAGADQLRDVGETVALDGSGSVDPDGAALTYSWALVSKPAGSTAGLSGAANQSPTLLLDVAGSFVLSLVVSDGMASSAADTVTITAQAIDLGTAAGGGSSQTGGGAVPANAIHLFPGDSFETAVESLQPGDTLVVHEGTYSDTGRISIGVKGTAQAPVVIMGAEGEARPLIMRPSTAVAQNTINIEGATHLTIKGLEITGNGGDGVKLDQTPSHITLEDLEVHEVDVGFSMQSSMNNIIARKNHIYNTGSDGGTGEGMYVGCHSGGCAVSDSIFESNWIHDNLPGTTQGDGIEIKAGSYNNIVRNNIIHDMRYPCIFVYGGGPDKNIVEGNALWNCNEAMQVVSDAVIRNNIIFNSTIGINAAPHSVVAGVSNVTIVNNTLFGHSGQCLYIRWSGATNNVLANNAAYCPGSQAVNATGLSEAGVTVSTNFVEGSMVGASIDDAGFVSGGTAGSAFTDTLQFDFWPTATSVLREAADPIYMPAVDFNETARTTPHDVGAYETEGLTANPGWQVADAFKGGQASSGGGSSSAGGTPANNAPVADAGAAQSVDAGQTVTLDGSGSTDPDGDTLSYAWQLTSTPAGSAAVLSDVAASSPTFVADVAGTYVASLVVSDALATSTAATVTITAAQPAGSTGGGTGSTTGSNTGSGTVATCGPGAGIDLAPYPQSSEFCGVDWDFTSIITRAPGSDNWPITWSDDDHQYTIWGDGGGFGGNNSRGRVSLGVGRIEGPADSYTGHNVWGGFNAENPAQFGGKVYGIISINGVLYAWLGSGGDNSGDAVQESTIITSHDKGATWVRPSQPMFTNADGVYYPSFLNYGKDNAGAGPFVYSYFPRGTASRLDFLQYTRPGLADLARVPTSQITDKTAFEWFAGFDGQGNPTWTSDMTARVAVFEDANGIFVPGVTYNPTLQRYFLTAQNTGLRDSRFGVFVSENPWGPWKTVTYETNWPGGRDLLGLYFSPKWWSTDGFGFTMVYTSTDRWATIQGQFTTPTGAGSGTGTTAGTTTGGTTTGGAPVTLNNATITNTQPASYVWDTLADGTLVYIDRNYTYTSVPAAYHGLAVLRTGNNDKASTKSAFLTFDVSDPVTVYVAFDQLTAVPAWLSGWTATGDTLQGHTTFDLYKRDFTAGTVVLGGNQGNSSSSMYTVLINAPGDSVGAGSASTTENNTGSGTTTGGTTTGGTTTGGTTSGQSALAQLAASMQPGEWAELQTNNISATFSANGASGTQSIFSDDIVWNPLTQQLFFLGGDHSDPAQFISYDAATNTWQRLPRPTWMGSFTHGYDHSAIDPATGTLYHRPTGQTNFYKYTPDTATWEKLPTLSRNKCCDSVEFFPELGGPVWATGANDVWLFNETTQQWSLLADGLNLASTWIFGEYNPVHKVFVFGSSVQNSLYKLSADGQVTTLKSPPITFYDGTGYVGDFTVDPVSGDYLALTPGRTKRQLYSYDVVTDSWQLLASQPPIDLASTAVIATPVADHGVTLFTYCWGRTTCGVLLYKHSAGQSASTGGSSPTNTAPVADAGAAQSVDAGQTVTLDGSGSADPDGDSLSYAWQLTSQPAGSAAVLSGDTSANPTFVADVTGTYVASLVVSDALATSTAATVTITASAVAAAGTAPAGTAGGTSGGTSSGGTGTTSSAAFADLCADPNVILCDPLDNGRVTGVAVDATTPCGTLSEVLDPTTPCTWGDWRWAGTNGTYPPQYDPNTGTGSGSLKLTFGSQSSAGDGGLLAVSFSPDHSVQLGENETFFVRWKQRFSCEVIYVDCDPTSPTYKTTRRFYRSTNGGVTAFKTLILNADDYPLESDRVTSCTWQHMVINHGPDHRIAGYHSCGWYKGWEESRGFVQGSSQIDRQPGGDNSCMRILDAAGTKESWGNIDPDCVKFDSDQWYTFQMQVSVGTWQPVRSGTPSTNVKLWVTDEAGFTAQVLDHNFYNRGPEASTPWRKYGKVWLLNYMTRKDATEVHPEGYTWYDELIVSRTLIPN